MPRQACYLLANRLRIRESGLEGRGSGDDRADDFFSEEHEIFRDQCGASWKKNWRLASRMGREGRSSAMGMEARLVS